MSWLSIKKIGEKARSREADIMSEVTKATGQRKQNKMDKSNAEDWVKRKTPAAKKGYE